MSKITNEAEWRKLYELAAQIKKLAPWEFLAEDTLIGVEDPETGRLGAVSIMGMNGEHYALHIYLGEEGFWGFWNIQEITTLNPLIVNDQLLQIPQLQLSFEDRDFLEKEDRDLVKGLGLKFRGRNAWPMFRHLEPGYAPWFVEPKDLPFFTIILEQTLQVLNEYEDKLEELDHEELEYLLVRTAKKRGEKLVWKGEWRKIPELEGVTVEVLAPIDEVVKQFKALPASYEKVEIEMLLIPTPILDKTITPRPFYPYLLLVVDQKSGQILGQHMGMAVPNRETMWRELPLVFCDFFAQGKFRYKTALFRNPLLASILEPFFAKIGIKIKVVDGLPRSEGTLLSLLGMLSGGFLTDEIADHFLDFPFSNGPEA
jgi:hypothetical protein